ncbi:MAG: DUF2474 family protein [Geminicoccaceae bacterium]
MGTRTVQRLGWFVLLWCGGVGAVGAVAYALRAFLAAAR